MSKCEKIFDCPFFINFPKHAEIYKYVYCEGPKLDSCIRLSYKEKNGTRPPEGLAPTGALIDVEE